MKFGCCINMLGTPEDVGGLRALEAVKRAGFDYVEVPLAEVMLLDDAAFQRLLARMEKLKLVCESCNNFFPGDIRLTGQDRDANQIQEYLLRALTRVAALGAKTVVFGSAKAKNVPDGFPMEDAWEQIGENLRLISDTLDQLKLPIRIAIEPICRRESNILLTYTEGCDMAEKVNRPNIECLVDFYHFEVEHEQLEDLRRGVLRHVHISNPDGRVFPAFGDGAGYKGFFDMLKQVGYDSCVSVEAYTKDFETDAERALECLRSFVG